MLLLSVLGSPTRVPCLGGKRVYENCHSGDGGTSRPGGNIGADFSRATYLARSTAASRSPREPS